MSSEEKQCVKVFNPDIVELNIHLLEQLVQLSGCTKTVTFITRLLL